MALPKVIGTQYGSPNAQLSAQKDSKIWTKKKTYEEVKIVLANCDDDEDDILGTTGIPAMYDILRGMTCIEVSPRETESILFQGALASLWEVTCKYDTDGGGADGKDPDTPPQEQTPTVRWTSENEDEHMEKDQMNDPLQTAANEPIFVTVPQACPILEITRYEDYPFDPDIILDYVNHTNSQPFWGAPLNSALMVGINSDEEDKENERLVKVTYRIKFKLKTIIPGGPALQGNSWWLRLLHCGQKFRPAAGEPPQVWMDAEGNTGTVNLAADGTLLAVNAPPQYLTFIRHASVDFNNLSLGPF